MSSHKSNSIRANLEVRVKSRQDQSNVTSLFCIYNLNGEAVSIPSNLIKTSDFKTLLNLPPNVTEYSLEYDISLQYLKILESYIKNGNFEKLSLDILLSMLAINMNLRSEILADRLGAYITAKAFLRELNDSNVESFTGRLLDLHLFYEKIRNNLLLDGKESVESKFYEQSFFSLYQLTFSSFFFTNKEKVNRLFNLIDIFVKQNKGKTNGSYRDYLAQIFISMDSIFQSETIDYTSRVRIGLLIASDLFSFNNPEEKDIYIKNCVESSLLNEYDLDDIDSYKAILRSNNISIDMNQVLRLEHNVLVKGFRKLSAENQEMKKSLAKFSSLLSQSDVEPMTLINQYHEIRNMADTDSVFSKALSVDPNQGKNSLKSFLKSKKGEEATFVNTDEIRFDEMSLETSQVKKRNSMAVSNAPIKDNGVDLVVEVRERDLRSENNTTFKRKFQKKNPNVFKDNKNLSIISEVSDINVNDLSADKLIPLNLSDQNNDYSEKLKQLSSSYETQLNDFYVQKIEPLESIVNRIRKILTMRIYHRDPKDDLMGVQVRFLNGHDDHVRCLTTVKSNNLLHLVSGSDDKMIKVWNPKTFELIKTLEGHQKYIICMATLYYKGRNLLLSGSEDSKVLLWDFDNFTLIKTLSGHQKGVWSMLAEINENGVPIVITGGEDFTIKLWDISKGTVVISRDAHESYVRSLCTLKLSSGDTILVSGGEDKLIKMWNLDNLNPLGTLMGHEKGVRAIKSCYLNGQSLIVSASEDNSIILWNPSKQAIIQTLKAHEKAVRCLEIFNFLGTTIVATGSADNTIKLWDIQKSQVIKTLRGHSDFVFALHSVSIDNETLLLSGSKDNSIGVWLI